MQKDLLISHYMLFYPHPHVYYTPCMSKSHYVEQIWDLHVMCVYTNSTILPFDLSSQSS